MFATSLQLNTGRHVGLGHPTYIIAEMGSNHNGSLEKASQLVQQAAQAGADAVKIQSFQVDQLINRLCLQNEQWVPHPAWDILERLTVPVEWHQTLSEVCKASGVDFLSAPFDLERLHLLDSLNVPAIKIASGDLTHYELLSAVGALNKPVILSTGLAHLDEVSAALEVLKQSGCTQVALLHCVSLYPPRFNQANIRAMVTMQQAFNVPVGYSDHTPGATVPLGAVALGASIIEKHFTDDKTQPGPDHPYALNVDEFAQMVSEIRNLEAALGDGVKQPAEGESPERVGARRAIYAKSAIQKGQTLSLDNLLVVRHAYQEGIPATSVSQIVGKMAAFDIQPHQLLTWEQLV